MYFLNGTRTKTVCVCFQEEPGPGPGGGLCFADGRRRVDYVLVHHCKRRHAQHRLSVVSNGNVPSQSPTPSRRSTKGDITEVVLEAGLATEPDDGLKDKIREEFERGLQEEGLEIERDKEVCAVLQYILNTVCTQASVYHSCYKQGHVS